MHQQQWQRKLDLTIIAKVFVILTKNSFMQVSTALLHDVAENYKKREKLVSLACFFALENS